MKNIFESRAQLIYKAILANGKMLVDFRDLEQVINKMVKNNVCFKVDNTESMGIYQVIATKIPVGQM